MKRKLTKAEWEALSAEARAFYVQDGDGYKLSLVDDDDPEALRRARDRERDGARDLRTQVRSLEDQLDIARNANRDVTSLDASWKKKFEDREKELNVVISSQRSYIDKTLIDQAIAKVAGAVTAKPEHAELLKPHIAARFEVIHDGDTPVVKIKDKDGKLSAMTFDDLQKEIAAVPTFASIVVASKASGGGAIGQSGSSNGGAGKKLKELSEKERVALFQNDPVEYRRRKLEEGF